ncbi:MAG: hypothetical protein KDB23_08190, partial [Planctomycetales bacterium]|nr:hypothetical protein [Planctomycetales bacterium]
MRFQRLYKRTRVGLPLMMLALTTNPLAAQFREVVPQNATPKLQTNLQPTRQQFTSPRAMEPIPQANTRITTTSPRREGSPTPAALPQSVPLPGVTLPASDPVTVTMQPTPVATGPVTTSTITAQAGAQPQAAQPIPQPTPPGVAQPTETAPLANTQPTVVSQSEPATPVAQPEPLAAAPVAAAEVQPTPPPVATAADAAATVPPTTVVTQSPTPVQPTSPTVVAPAIVTPVAKANPWQSFRGGDNTNAPTPRSLTVATPISFNQITPGSSTVAAVVSAWGEAAKTVGDGDSKRLIYRAPGFRQVDVVSDDNDSIVDMVLVHLSDSVPLPQMIEQLQLQGIRTVEVRDEQGVALGCGFPERGVLLTYSPGTTSQQVSHVSLEPISGELFRLRAETDATHSYADSLADLDQAIRLNSQDAKAHWLQAELYSLVGRSQDAITKADDAVRIAVGNPLYQLTKAR